MSEQRFNVTEMHTASSDVYRVVLEPQHGKVPAYKAGQYAEVLLKTGQTCAFSLASAPVQHQESFELHIQKIIGSDNSQQLFSELDHGYINLRMPKGRCFLPEKLPDTPLVFVAAGTGFAQMKSMVEYCFNKQHCYDIHLYWGARTPADFYLPHIPIQWSEKGVRYHPVVSDAVADDDWCGRHGLLYEALLADKDILQGSNIYFSGSPKMVYTTIDVMKKAGFIEKHMHSDVFDYAPR